MKRLCVGAAAIMAAFTPAAMADDMLTSVRAIASDDGGPGTYEFGRLANGVMQMQPGERITMNFGAGYEVELDEIRVLEMGARVWSGRLESSDDVTHRVLLSETNGDIFGRVVTEDGIWHIIPDAGGHRIMQMPASARPLYHPEDYRIPDPMALARLAESGSPDVGEDIAEMVPVGSNGTIDIAVFYSQSFSALWGLASGGRVQYLMAVLDQALIDSDTGLRARLVHLDSVNLTTDSSDQGVTLNNLSGDPNNNQPVTQDLSTLRQAGQTYGADLVALVQRALQGQTSCGIAWTNGTSGTLTPQEVVFGYSVTADWMPPDETYSCGDATFAHEIGHNMGFVHNVEQEGQVGGGIRQFAHGHRVDCHFQTIMSYPSTNQQINQCPGGSPNGIGGETTVFYFSNPELMRCPPNDNSACGRPFNDPDPADTARAAREESRNIVNFRAEASRVVSSVLPITRSVQNGTAATAFASIINPANTGSSATGCGLRLAGSSGAQFSYQTTSAQNAPTGTANTPVDIPAGGVQSFVFSVTSAGDFSDNQGLTQPSANNETNLFIEAFCANRRSAEYTLGLNSLTFSSSAAAPADVIALAATVGNTGRVDVPTTGNQVGVFSVAVSNIGTSASITATPDLGGRTIGGVNTLEICRTDPNTGACTTARAASQTLTVNQNETATFGVFIRGNGQAIPNDPARNRVFVRFNEGMTPRGATSVAVRTQ